MTPVVGMTSIPKPARTAFGDRPHETLPELYVNAIAGLGAVPVILPVRARPLAEVLERLDGLILTGGGDVNPAAYGQEPDPLSKGMDPDRDRFEIEITRRAVEREIPVLAICRGVQVLNVAFGGTLVQDIPGQVGERVSHWDPDRWDRDSHEVEFEPTSRIAGLLGESLGVNSIHHQAVDRVAPDLRVVGRTPDGVVEAVEMPDARFCLGVQWHPECLGSGHASFRLFQSFVDTAREVRP